MIKLYESNKYGCVEVLDDRDRHAIRVRFVDTGYETVVRLHNLTQGKVVDHPVKSARTNVRKAAYIPPPRKRSVRVVPCKASTPADMMTGSRHDTARRGWVIVMAYHNANNVEVYFENTGYPTKTSSHSLRNGADLRDPLAVTVFGVGRIGTGPHSAHANGVDTPAFRIWRAMLRRCYGDEHRPTYEGCSVCAEWLDFQTFAGWFELNYRSGYELDKDIRIPGNKQYSPGACQFVTKQQNLAARRWP